MAYEEFFTDSDKPYAENLNDSLVLTDAFDLSVPLCMPDGFSNGEFSSTLNVTRKCNVGLVTLKSVGSGVTVGTGQISGSGEVVFRVYPNFNCFYKWDKVIVEKSGTVGISFRKPDGSGITATVGSDGVISDSSALKQLSEVDVVFVLSDATISNILIWFVNNHNKSVRTGALLEASQLANVDGEVVSGETKAVNGGTVKTALDNLHTTVTGEIEDLSDNITSETDSKLALKEDKSNKVTSLDSSDTHYPSSNAVKNVTDGKANKIFNREGGGYVPSQLKYDHYTNNSTTCLVVEISDFEISSSESSKAITGTIFNNKNVPACNQITCLSQGLYAELTTNGRVYILNPFNQSVSGLTCSFSFLFIQKKNLNEG